MYICVTKPNNMTTINKTNAISEINLYSVRSSRYDDNVERLGDHSDTCFLCGKRTSEDLFVHYTSCGELTNDNSHPESQGCFPIGPECAKKLPKDFVKKLC
jgi:hypothetical protein